MIVAERLTKRFAGLTAVDDVSFHVRRGEIVGFLGPNGAGKSTTMRMLACFLPATSGAARVAGYDVFRQSRDVRRHLGYMPEGVPLYGDLRVSEYLRYRAKVKGVGAKDLSKAVDRVIEDCWLGERRRQVIGTLSKGYRQRVALADVLIHDPAVLILDEPTVGLDPEQVVEARELIRNLRGSRTVILSTHILPEVELICERVLVIQRGRIIADETTKGLTERLLGGKVFTVRIGAAKEDVLAAFRSIPDLKVAHEAHTDGPGERFSVRAVRDARADVAALAGKRGWPLLELAPKTLTLEEVFVRLVRREDDPRGGASGAPGADGGASAAAGGTGAGGAGRGGDASSRSVAGPANAAAAAASGAGAAAPPEPGAKRGFALPALVGKELRSMFLSPIAYFVTTAFLVITGIYFFMIVRAYSLEAPPQIPPMQHIFRGFFYWVTFLVILPAVTMRLLAEEMKSGTIETLMTAPVSDLEVVLSKYLATLVFFAAMWVPTLAYVAILHFGGSPDPGPIAAAYLGTLLLGSVFISIGLFASSLTRDQIVAAVLGFLFSMAMLSMGFVQQYVQVPALEELLNYISFFSHSTDFGNGIVDTRHVVYYATLTAFFLFLTVRSVESRKWR
jgi:ABC-2 type transport system ATP-binding protein